MGSEAGVSKQASCVYSVKTGLGTGTEAALPFSCIKSRTKLTPKKKVSWED
jgi:hypothetical protein